MTRGASAPLFPAVGVDGLVPLDDVRAAAARVQGMIVRTPLLASPEVSERVGHEVRFKCESLQRSGSFKFRGALNFVLQLPHELLAKGVITYSSGNHGQAVALAARLRGVHAVVVMPTTAPEIKVSGAEQLGAEVVLEGTTSIERKIRAEAIAQADGLAMVQPFDHPWIIAGQGTMGIEIYEDWPEVEAVLVPIGGGGMMSGVCAALRRLRPDVRLVGVEPFGAASMRAALNADGPVTLPGTHTIADGLAPVRVGDLTFKHVRQLADDVVTVDDGMIREAVRFLLLRAKLVVECSGAAALAALLSGVVGSPGRTAVIISGGNVDLAVKT
ncbi:MAG TPA: pyridoxal-5'-phosphate-dependent protein [Gemmatimonadetes bacterium]|nr:pyridoxal-5'-phosphate-dependent protein [Gemmatimonadota bacterium]|tara:strand:+ start:5392 stop:6378 length:987 start_codon:yes stop_codon:yes gene_type:complete